MSTLTTPPAEQTRRTTTRSAPAQNVGRFSLQAVPDGDANRPVPNAIVPGLGNVTTGFVDVGSSPSQYLKLTITNLHLTTNSPAAIICQPRQNANQDFNFPDIFAVQVITTAADHMVVLIRRMDGNSGWGQDLRLDVVIFDSINNP